MCKFVTEVKKHNNKDYPPQSLRGMVLAIQFFLHSNCIYWQLLPKQDGEFVDLYYVVDNVMKGRTMKGLGVVKHATPVSCKMENEMWSKGVLGEDEPEKLVKTMFLLGVNFALRGGG